MDGERGRVKRETKEKREREFSSTARIINTHKGGKKNGR